MTRNLLLDFGGVCLLSPVELHRHVERSLGVPEGTFTWLGPLDPSTDELWQRLLRDEISERDYWHRRAADVGRAAHKNGWTLRDYMQVCFDGPEEVIIRRGATSIVAEVRAAGGKAGILTNDLTAFHGQDWVDSISLLRDADSLTDASKTGILKPDPRAYLDALRELRVGRDEVVFVDDQPKNVAGARSLGIETVFFDVAHPDKSWAEARRLLDLAGPRAEEAPEGKIAGY